jgi:Kelch motif
MALRMAAATALITLFACTATQQTTPSSVPTTTSPPQWQTMAEAPTSRTEVTGATLDDRILVTGGFVEGGATVPLVEVYQPRQDRWEEGPPLPIALNHAMSAVADGTVIVAGGYRGPGLTNPSDRVFALSNGEGWVEMARLPESRAAGGMAAVGATLVVVGGVGSGGLIETTAVWDPEVAVWEEVAGLITPREHLGVAAAGGRVYAVGGRTTGLGNLASFEVFDLSLMDWERLPDLPTPRGGLAASAIGDLVIAVGGEEQATFDEVEAYDVVRGEWVSLPALPTARHGLAVVAWEGILFVLSGGTEPGYSFSAANEALTVGTG